MRDIRRFFRGGLPFRRNIIQYIENDTAVLELYAEFRACEDLAPGMGRYHPLISAFFDFEAPVVEGKHTACIHRALFLNAEHIADVHAFRWLVEH